MKLSRFFFTFVLILCGNCFLFQTWAAGPVQPGSQPGQANAPKKAVVNAAPITKPDLVITFANFNHAPKTGEELGTESILNIQVKNQGTLQSPQNTVKITCTPLSGKPCPEGLSGTQSCGSLSPNQAATLPWPNSGGTWSAGSFKLTIEVDSGKTVAELNEGNNTKTLNTTILATTASGASAQSAGNQQYAGNATPGPTPSGKKVQVQSLQNSQNNLPAASAAANLDTTLLPLSITSPTNGAAFYVGKKYTLTWTDLQKQAQNVKITLISKTTNAVTNIAKDVPNTGTYEWTVTQGSTSNNHNYALKIQGMGQNANYSDSKDITIYIPSLHITKPQAGDTWNKPVPVSHTITWQKSNMPEDVFGSKIRVRIGSYWSLPGGWYDTTFFTTETLNDGEYVYTTLHEIPNPNIRFGQYGCFVAIEALDGSVSDVVKITIVK